MLITSRSDVPRTRQNDRTIICRSIRSRKIILLRTQYRHQLNDVTRGRILPKLRQLTRLFPHKRPLIIGLQGEISVIVLLGLFIFFARKQRIRIIKQRFRLCTLSQNRLLIPKLRLTRLPRTSITLAHPKQISRQLLLRKKNQILLIEIQRLVKAPRLVKSICFANRSRLGGCLHREKYTQHGQQEEKKATSQKRLTCKKHTDQTVGHSSKVLVTILVDSQWKRGSNPKPPDASEGKEAHLG